MHCHSLPVEVLYLILDQVVLGGDFRTVKAISMVSKTFRKSCRKHLFHRIVLTFASDRHYAQNPRENPSSFLEFTAFLIANPHILNSVRNVTLRDNSGISSWDYTVTGVVPSSGSPLLLNNDHEHDSHRVAHPHIAYAHAQLKWNMIAGSLTQILGSLEHLEVLEIRSELELDWTTFDIRAKNAIYSLLARPSCGSASVILAALRNVGDRDLLEFVKHCGELTLLNVHFSLRGLRRISPIVIHEKDKIMIQELNEEVKDDGDSDEDGEHIPCFLQETDEHSVALRKLKLGRQVGVDAVDWLAHHPASLVGIKHLAMESLSAAIPVADYWAFAQGTRASLEHLEWWFEDLAFREQSDALALKQIDLSVLPHLRSFTIRSSQSGLLINLMVILESTYPSNAIETITIVMPTSIDKFVAFRPSAVWKRIDSAFGSARFKKHLRTVALSFAWTNQPMTQNSLLALFSAFKRNLPSLSGKDLTVDQRRACIF